MIGRPISTPPNGACLRLRQCVEGSQIGGRRAGLMARSLMTTTGTATPRKARPARSMAPSSLSLPTTGPLQKKSMPFLPWESRRNASKPRQSPTARRAARQSSQSPSNQSPKDKMGEVKLTEAINSLEGRLDRAIEKSKCPLTVDECMKIYKAYRDIHVTGERPTESALLLNYNITPYELHTAATLLIFAANDLPNQSGATLLSSGLMELASDMSSQPGGYMPSVLTLLNIYTRVDRYDKNGRDRGVREKKFYKKALLNHLAYMQRHKMALVLPEQPSKSGKQVSEQDVVMQANTFTMAGFLMEDAGRLDQAVEWYKAAQAVGRQLPAVYKHADGEEKFDDAEIQAKKDNDTLPRENKWDWERTCLEGIARLHERLSGTESGSSSSLYNNPAAWSAALTAVLALNSREGRVQLAMAILERSNNSASKDSADDIVAQKGEELLREAAIAGVAEACEALADLNSLKAAGADSKEEAAVLEKMGEEWAMIWEAHNAVDALANK